MSNLRGSIVVTNELPLSIELNLEYAPLLTRDVAAGTSIAFDTDAFKSTYMKAPNAPRLSADILEIAISALENGKISITVFIPGEYRPADPTIE
jgi:hypothetical protein